MTREEAIKRLGMGFPGSIEEGKKYGQAVEMAISALSTDGEYIKKEDLFERTINRNSAWNTITDSSGWGLEEIVNDLPTYSFPDSKSVINKVLEIIKSQRFKAYDWYASLAPTVGKSWQKDYEADMEIYDGVIEAVELYRDSDSAENKPEPYKAESEGTE